MSAAPTITIPLEALQQKFDLGIWYALFQWPELTVAIKEQWGGPDSSEKRDWLAGAISEQFERDPQTDVDDVSVMLLQVLEDEFGTRLDDDSEEKVAGLIMQMRKEMAEGSTATVDELEEKWRARQGKEVPTGAVNVREAEQEGEWDSVDEESEDDGDVDMGDAPALVPAQPRQPKEEPQVDEDGFTMVKKKR